MTSLSDRPFHEAARRVLLAAAVRLEALPPDTDLSPLLSTEHVLTFARLVAAPLSWIGGVRADTLAACLRIEADCHRIPADVLNLSAAAAPEGR